MLVMLLGTWVGVTLAAGRGSPPLPGQPAVVRPPSAPGQGALAPAYRSPRGTGYWTTMVRSGQSLSHRRVTLSARAMQALLARARVLAYGPATAHPRFVALTLDDGPSFETLRTLEILRRTGARATFFVIGHQALNPFLRPLLSQMHRDGHQVENHTYSHELGAAFGTARFATAGARHQEQEIRRADAVLPRPTHFLRVPGGLFPRDRVTQTIAVARKMRKVVVNWDVDGDTPGPARTHRGRITGMTPRDMLNHYLSRVRPGSIILMHPEHASGAPYTLEILEPLIRRLQERGYVLVTLDELMTGTPERRVSPHAPRRRRPFR